MASSIRSDIKHSSSNKIQEPQQKTHAKNTKAAQIPRQKENKDTVESSSDEELESDEAPLSIAGCLGGTLDYPSLCPT
jgi:hypothetical protein